MSESAKEHDSFELSESEWVEDINADTPFLSPLPSVNDDNSDDEFILPADSGSTQRNVIGGQRLSKNHLA